MAYGFTATVNTGQMPSSQTGFVWLLTADNFPTAAVDGGATSIDNGGGNLRCYTDSSKATALPIEVVTFVTGGTPSCVVWGRSSSLGVGDTVYCEADDTETAQPAVTDPLGRNAVWQDFDVVYHFEGGSRTVDSAGNYDLSETGTITTITGNIGDAASYGGVDSNYHSITGYQGPTGNSARTITCWGTASTDNLGLFEYGVNETGSRFAGRIDASTISGGFRVEVQGSYAVTNDTFDDGNYHRFVSKVDGTSSFPSCHTSIVDGIERSVTTGSNITINTSHSLNFQLRQHLTVSGSIPANRSNFTVRAFETSNSLDLSEYNNQNDPASFWSSSAWEDQGGSSIDIGGQSSNVNYSTTNAIISLVGNLNVQGQSSNFEYQSIDATVGLAGFVNIAGQSSNINYQSINASIEFDSQLTIQGQPTTIEYAAIGAGVAFDGLVNVYGQSSNYEYQSIGANVQLLGDIDIAGQSSNYEYIAINGIISLTSGDSLNLSNISLSYADDGITINYSDDGITVTYG